MSTSMEFWGISLVLRLLDRVEVKSGQPLKINPGDNKIVHLSQASLGEVKKGSEPVCLYIKVNDKKLVLGTLSAEKFPQLSFDLVVEKDFELSHNWKIGKYAVEVPLTNNGKDESRANSVSEKNATKPDSSAAKQKVKNVKPNQQAEDSDSDDGDLEGSSTDDDENSDEEAELRNKRPAESATKTPVPDKKAKFITPQKTEGKKGISHTATPYPSKQAGKTPANSDQAKQQAKKSGGSYSCKSCNRSFTTDGGLQAHTKAKHTAAA
ncbi:hypothetical protein EZV62_016175 [Acer yangbiense]|uniref:C2H2-type domain-containing protein n=1 Tax=Acer yangbiense TaxID=1000413 RepID=A0A5C7HPU4_9ROSI|nr:hypothetical protein EZV62_016175 [Acer yangbiense]